MRETKPDRITIKRMKKIKSKDFLSIRKRNPKNIIETIEPIEFLPTNTIDLLYKNLDY